MCAHSPTPPPQSTDVSTRAAACRMMHTLSLDPLNRKEMMENRKIIGLIFKTLRDYPTGQTMVQALAIFTNVAWEPKTKRDLFELALTGESNFQTVLKRIIADERGDGCYLALRVLDHLAFENPSNQKDISKNEPLYMAIVGAVKQQQDRRTASVAWRILISLASCPENQRRMFGTPATQEGCQTFMDIVRTADDEEDKTSAYIVLKHLSKTEDNAKMLFDRQDDMDMIVNSIARDRAPHTRTQAAALLRQIVTASTVCVRAAYQYPDLLAAVLVSITRDSPRTRTHLVDLLIQMSVNKENLEETRSDERIVDAIIAVIKGDVGNFEGHGAIHASGNCRVRGTSLLTTLALYGDKKWLYKRPGMIQGLLDAINYSLDHGRTYACECLVKLLQDNWIRDQLYNRVTPNTTLASLNVCIKTGHAACLSKELRTELQSANAAVVANSYRNLVLHLKKSPRIQATALNCFALFMVETYLPSKVKPQEDLDWHMIEVMVHIIQNADIDDDPYKKHNTVKPVEAAPTCYSANQALRILLLYASTDKEYADKLLDPKWGLVALLLPLARKLPLAPDNDQHNVAKLSYLTSAVILLSLDSMGAKGAKKWAPRTYDHLREDVKCIKTTAKGLYGAQYADLVGCVNKTIAAAADAAGEQFLRELEEEAQEKEKKKSSKAKKKTKKKEKKMVKKVKEEVAKEKYEKKRSLGDMESEMAALDAELAAVGLPDNLMFEARGEGAEKGKGEKVTEYDLDILAMIMREEKEKQEAARIAWENEVAVNEIEAAVLREKEKEDAERAEREEREREKLEQFEEELRRIELEKAAVKAREEAERRREQAEEDNILDIGGVLMEAGFQAEQEMMVEEEEASEVWQMGGDVDVDIGEGELSVMSLPWQPGGAAEGAGAVAGGGADGEVAEHVNQIVNGMLLKHSYMTAEKVLDVIEKQLELARARLGLLA